MIYGGDWNTLVRKHNVDAAVAQAAENGFFRKYPGIRKARERTFNSFCSMRQPQGIGKAVVWEDPADYIETFLGFRRYFTLENRVAKTLFQMANKPPKKWKELGGNVKVCRRDRVQFACGALQSALYGAAFAIQACNMRAAANHEIQSPGAEITKKLERNIWDLQPHGVHEFVVAPLNIHDELMVPTLPSHVDAVSEVVRTTVEGYRENVPLIGITWNKGMKNWAEKKGGAETIKVRSPLIHD
jgi:DNA polymerase I-like protein with 3'-5' exonuclease and polymerase domains